MSKRRITVTVDDALVADATAAVAAGRAESVSAWVNASMAARAKRDRQLDALAQLVTEYEAQYGEITESELAEQQRSDRGAPVAATRAARSKR